MNPRERKLAMVTGGVVLVLGLNWGFGKYRTSIETAQDQIQKLTQQVSGKKDQIFDGAMARKSLGELRERSLPSDPQRASALYQEWLTNLVSDSGLSGVTVDKTQEQGFTNPQGQPLYRRYTFKSTGAGTLSQIAQLLDDFYGRAILHRITKLVVNPDPARAGRYTVAMDVDAVSLNDAPKDRELPGVDRPKDSPRSEAAMAFLQRNPFSPPNQPPKFAGEANPRAVIGQPFEYAIRFEDPEKQSVSVELVGEAPEGLRMERGRIEWQPNQLGRYDLAVRAVDDGWPSRSIEQKLTIQVDNPPPPAEVPKFDESRTAVLTGLVRIGEQWQAWINIRTQTKTLRLVVGDQIKVGAIEGEVKEITDGHAIIQMQDKRLIIKPGESLADAKPAT